MESLLFVLTYALFATLYATAFVIALGFWRRCRFASGLMLASTAILLLVLAGRAFLQFHLVNIGLNGEVFAIAFASLGLVQWVGHALMIAAVFANRNPQASDRRWPKNRYAEDDDWDDPPIAPAPRSSGVQDQQR